MGIYRAEEDADPGSFKEMKDRDTRRPPSNVPYVVDNLWAWARWKQSDGEDYPDRRQSKFASPTPEQALRSVGLPEDAYEHVFRIEFVGDPVIAQLPGCEDAKYHSDCDDLRSLLFDKLGGKYDWSSKDLINKHPASQLFQPCLMAEEVDYLLDITEELNPYKKEIQDAIDYWCDLELADPDDLADEEKGEILFEFSKFDGKVGYHRQPVKKNR